MLLIYTTKNTGVQTSWKLLNLPHKSRSIFVRSNAFLRAFVRDELQGIWYIVRIRLKAYTVCCHHQLFFPFIHPSIVARKVSNRTATQIQQLQPHSMVGSAENYVPVAMIRMRFNQLGICLCENKGFIW